MRTLLLFRWAPGCGKSTFIREHWLEPFTLSADSIRMLYASPTLYPNGEVHIPQHINSVAWDELFTALEYRMNEWEFTVIDATNSKTAEMNKYKRLAEEYRYRIYIIDFTTIPLEECLRRNKQRSEWKWVPEDAIENMYSRFTTQNVPSGIKTIKPEEIETLRWKPIEIDSTKYKEVIHIWDIHWCYETLMSALPNGIEEDKFYIFLWDYIERWPESAKVLDYMESISDLPNVAMLEWNHEWHLWTYATGKIPRSRTFNWTTLPHLLNNWWNEKRMRMFVRKLLQCFYYTYNWTTVLCTHWGISNANFDNLFPLWLTCISTRNLIHWIGSYNDTKESDTNFAKGNMYACHWHRNIEDVYIDWIANLEWGVEFWKELRTAVLSRDIEVGNHMELVNYPYCDKVPEDVQSFWVKQDITVKQFIEDLRNNWHINEKKLWGNISSFNFDRWAFHKSRWDKETIKARGLFINIDTCKIVARAYNKFFNVDEQKCTMLFSIANNSVFPIVGYKKYNGYLWIVWYDEQTDSLIYTSKSEVGWPHALWLRQILDESWVNMDAVKEYLKENLCSLVFEVIDPINDPHIIKYNKRQVVLLDCVSNTIAFNKLPYEELLELGNRLWIQVKEKMIVCNNMDELREVINELNDINSKYNTWEPIEWMVFVDENDFMFKQKGAYYLQWKKLRSIIKTVSRWQNFVHTWMLINPEMNEFYWWLKWQKLTWEENIIELRDLFYRHKKLWLITSAK